MNERESRHWDAIGRVMAAHALMLRDTGMIDDDALAATLSGVDAARSGQPAGTDTLIGLVQAFDQRATSLSPSAVSGVLRVGRGDLDVLVTAVKLVARDDAIRFADQIQALRSTVLEFAPAHVVTLMPGAIDGQIAQPTSFAHALGGLFGPLDRATTRLLDVIGEINRSPMGAGAFASTGMPIDRERVAGLLGFAGVVDNTFDAVSSWDPLLAAAEAAAAAARPVRGLLEELETWIRIEPALLIWHDEPLTVDDLPQFGAPGRLSALVELGQVVERSTVTLRATTDALPWGPSLRAPDAVDGRFAAAIANAGEFLERAGELLRKGVDLNRALLANRAGRGFSTSSDLADFLMIEEQIDPASARQIAALTISRTREAGLEASGITPEIIDGAALLVIGREIKAEFEAISRYLAPRRFIERRTATGAPSPSAVRAYLEAEQRRLDAHAERIVALRTQWSAAASDLAALEAAATRI